MANSTEPGFFQGAPSPDVNTTTATTTTAPAWYNNFLSGLSSQGQDAINQGGVANFSDLQNQVFKAAPGAVNAGQGALSTAVNTATGVAGTPTIDMISQYMNPYTQQVIGEVGRLGQENWANKIAPGATAGAVGSGQFGSTRGMNVYGNLAREANRDITGQQGTLLQSGFNDALKAAQAQQTLDLQAAQQLGTLSGQQYTQGTGGLDVLNKLGAQQQANEQAKLNYPMSALTQVSNLIKGYTVPTTVTQKYTGPMPGAYAKSQAEIMGGLTTGAGAFFAKGPKGEQSQYEAIKSAVPTIADITKMIKGDSAESTDPTANYQYLGSTDSGGVYLDPVRQLKVDYQGNPISNQGWSPDYSTGGSGLIGNTDDNGGNNDSGFNSGNLDSGFDTSGYFG